MITQSIIIKNFTSILVSKRYSQSNKSIDKLLFYLLLRKKKIDVYIDDKQVLNYDKQNQKQIEQLIKNWSINDGTNYRTEGDSTIKFDFPTLEQDLQLNNIKATDCIKNNNSSFLKNRLEKKFCSKKTIDQPIYNNHVLKNKHFLTNYNQKSFYSRYSASTIMPHNTFNLNNYDIIGFDLDGTLLRYNLDAMVPMEYMKMAKFLVEKKGYPKELLNPIENDIDFLQKGLLLDSKRGNILKIGNDGVIGKASHGTKFLTEEEIKRIYGVNKTWDIGLKFIEDPLKLWNGPDVAYIRALLDHFDMPASLLMARCVDLINKQKDTHIHDYEVLPDIISSLVNIYSREHFVTGEGGYFLELKNDPFKYIHKSDPYIIEWLKELKKTKAIFLLTGSNIDFANFTANHALGHNWRDLFDVAVAYAKKPGFFTERRPFYSYQGGEEDQIVPDDEIKMGNVYAQGNWQGIENLLSKKFDKTIKNCNSLYFGDNLIQDVYTPSKFCNLDTIALVEELEEHDCHDGYAFKKVIQSNIWGSYFSIDDNKPTIWSEIISKHSKLCLPTIEHLCKNPIDYEYECTNSITKLCSSKIEI